MPRPCWIHTEGLFDAYLSLIIRTSLRPLIVHLLCRLESCFTCQEFHFHETDSHISAIVASIRQQVVEYKDRGRAIFFLAIECQFHYISGPGPQEARTRMRQICRKVQFLPEINNTIYNLALITSLLPAMFQPPLFTLPHNGMKTVLFRQLLSLFPTITRAPQ